MYWERTEFATISHLEDLIYNKWPLFEVLLHVINYCITLVFKRKFKVWKIFDLLFVRNKRMNRIKLLKICVSKYHWKNCQVLVDVILPFKTHKTALTNKNWTTVPTLTCRISILMKDLQMFAILKHNFNRENKIYDL